MSAAAAPVLLALFPAPADGGPDAAAGPSPGGEPCPPDEALAVLDPAAGHALEFGDDELRAAAGAGAAWRGGAPDSASPGWREAVARLLEGWRAHGALAVVLPAARKALGPAALDDIVPGLPGDAALLRLFVQVEARRRDGAVRTRSRGMAYLGLPDVLCDASPADAALAVQLVEGCLVHLAAQGAGALPPGVVLEATAPDGGVLSRLRIEHDEDDDDPARGDDGARGGDLLRIVPLPAGAPGVPGAAAPPAASPAADAPARLADALARGRRAVDLDLRGAALAGRDLGGLQADRLDLSRADLSGARLAQARLGGCRLHGADLDGVDAVGAVLRLCALDGARAAGARFDGARLEDGTAAGADLSASSLRDARLSGTTFERALLRDAVLDGASGDGVVFRGADLGGASLRGAWLDDADFRGADLRGADLSAGRFGSADFRGALLAGARLDDADLAAALFDGEGPPPARAADAGAAQPAAGGPGAAAGAAGPDEAAVAALRAALGGADRLLAAAGPGAVPGDLADRLRRGLAALEQCGDEPPEALRAWLEPLVRAAAGGGPAQGGTAADLHALLDALLAAAARPADGAAEAAADASPTRAR